MNMRKIAILMLSVAFVLTSCDSNEPDVTDGLYPISFSVGSITKVQAANVNDLVNADMRLCGIVGGQSTFSNQKIVWDETNGVWTYSPLQYWKQGAYKFRAVWPDSVYTYTDGLTGNDAVITGFTVPSDTAKQSDLLMSGIVSGTLSDTSNPPTGISFDFRHILSKVIFKVKKETAAQDDDVFRIIEFTVTGMKNKGSYTGSNTTGTWNYAGATSLTCTKSYALPGLKIDKGVTSTDWSKAKLIWKDGLLLLPQSISGDVKVNVTFSVTHDSKTDTKSLSLSLPSPSTGGWAAGKQYTYQLDINQ